MPGADWERLAKQRSVIPLARINAEVCEHRGGEVGGGNGFVGDIGPQPVGRAEDVPARSAAASDQRGEDVRPVIAAGLLRRGVLCELADLRRASELAERDD